MAGFRMHVTTSTVLGCGYAGVGHFMVGLPLESSIVGGALDLGGFHRVALVTATLLVAGGVVSAIGVRNPTRAAQPGR